jgi:NitT/TauT family transport system permease protein
MTIPQSSTAKIAATKTADWSPRLGDTTGAAAPKPAHGNPAQPKPARRLPVQRDWPTFAIVAVQIGILVGIVALWEIGAATGIVDKFFWSHPSAIFHTLTIFFATGDAFTDIAFTFRSTILGFLIGTAAGSALGLSFWWSRNYAAIVQPYIICFESLPKLALAPLIVLVFGIGIASKVAIATALTLVVSTLTTFAGVKAVDPDSEKLFYSLGATRFQVFRKLVIPSCLPWIISVLRVNIGLALTGAIVGEFIASQHGLGRAILYAGQTYDIALVWVAVSVLSVLAIVMYITVSWIEHVLRKGVQG